MAWLALWLGSVAAAPQPPEATRTELAAWLAVLGTAGPQRWQYSFAAPDTAPLEALSLALVGSGYAILTLAAQPAGGAQLTVTRRELHTPLTLERRNRDMRVAASEHGAHYEGVDLAPRP